MRSAAVGFGLVGFLGDEAAGEASADDVAAEPVLLLGEGVDAVDGFLVDADGDLGSGHDASVSHRVAFRDALGYSKGMTTTRTDLGNNERISRGIVRTSGGYLALTFAASKEFKTEAGAIKWLARRGINADGTRAE
jgi:hypothetical protein